MDRESFIFYRSFYEAIKCMPPEVQAEIYPAICDYALFGTQPENLSEVAKGMFMLIKPNIDVNTVRYNNGKKGGRKRTAKKAAPEAPAYAATYEQEVDRMRKDKKWRKTICDDYSITTQEYETRLDRFLDRCNDDKKRKQKDRHDSYADCQSHLRYWMSKAYPLNNQSTLLTPSPAPLSPGAEAEAEASFNGMDYEEQ